MPLAEKLTCRQDINSQHITVVCAVCPVQSISAVVDKMKAAGVPVELFMYAHCGHAFMNALTAGGREKIKGTRTLCYTRAGRLVQQRTHYTEQCMDAHGNYM